MALYGGPMKTSPASVHFRANAEFSLNCIPGSWLVCHLESKYSQPTYKAVARVYCLTPFFLCNLNNSITIEVCRHRPQIKSEGGTQGMLSSAIRIGVECCYADPTFRGSASNSSSMSKLAPSIIPNSVSNIQSDFSSIGYENRVQRFGCI